MEGLIAASRRINAIASHLNTAGANEEGVPRNRIFPLNCSSSSLNSVIRRCDNRTLFARQAPFMREVSVEEDFEHAISLQECTPLKSSGYKNEKLSNELPGAPLFARPAGTDANISIVGDHQPLKQEFELPAIQPSASARVSEGMIRQKQAAVEKIRHSCCCDGFEWSPRMDIAESRCSYAVTVELPGVSVNNIRVEVDDHHLIVTGKRSIRWWRVENVSVDSNPLYHRREILQGPYQAVWRFPDDVNKDRASAEFVDGFLQITVPKLSQLKGGG